MDGPDPGKRTDSSQLKMCKVMLQVSILLTRQIRPVRSNRRPPIAVYRTGLTENRLNSNPNLKSHVQPVPTGIPAGMTGLRIFHFLI